MTRRQSAVGTKNLYPAEGGERDCATGARAPGHKTFMVLICKVMDLK